MRPLERFALLPALPRLRATLRSLRPQEPQAWSPNLPRMTVTRFFLLIHLRRSPPFPFSSMPQTMQALENEVAFNLNRNPNMSNVALMDMQRIVRLAAEPRTPDDSVKAAIGRAARSLQLNYRRAYAFWYASDGTSPRAIEADRIRAEELRILANRRIRLERELDWIESRITARESRQNAERGTTLGGVAHESAQVAPLLSVASPFLDEPSEKAGTEGPIADARQIALPFGGRARL